MTDDVKVGGTKRKRNDEVFYEEEMRIRKDLFRNVMKQVYMDSKNFQNYHPLDNVSIGLRQKLITSLGWWTRLPPPRYSVPYYDEFAKRTTPMTYEISRDMFQNVFVPQMAKFSQLCYDANFSKAYYNIFEKTVAQMIDLILVSPMPPQEKNALFSLYHNYTFPTSCSAFRRLPLRASAPPTSIRTGTLTSLARCKTLKDAKFPDLGFGVANVVSNNIYTRTPEEQEAAKSSLPQVFDEKEVFEFLRNTDNNRGFITDFRLFDDDDGSSHAISPLVFLKKGAKPIVVVVNAWHFPETTASVLSHLSPVGQDAKVHIFPNDAISDEDKSFQNVQENDAGEGQCQEWSVILAYKFAKAFTYDDLLPQSRGEAVAQDYSSLYAKVKVFYKHLNDKNLTDLQRETGLLGGYSSVQCSVQ